MGTNLQATLSTGALNGSVTLNTDGSFTYTPNSSSVTSDSFTYSITSTSTSGSSSATVTITGSTTTTTTTLQAVGDSATISAGTATGNVLTNDTGPNLQAALSAGPMNGSVTLNTDGSFTYTPNSSSVTSDSFTYSITSTSTSGSSSATVTITGSTTTTTTAFDAIDDVITDVAMAGATDGNTLTNDLYGTATVTAYTQGQFGTVTVSTEGRVEYQQTQPFTTDTDSFMYTLTNSTTGQIATATVTVYPAGTGSPPTITSDGGGDTATITILENQRDVTDVQSTDPDGTTEDYSLLYYLFSDHLTYTITGGADQARFHIVANTGVLTFNAAPDFDYPSDSDANNEYNVQVTVTDPTGLTDFQDITVIVTCPPLHAVDDSAMAANGGPTEMYAMATVNVLENDHYESIPTVTAGTRSSTAYVQAIVLPDNQVQVSIQITPMAGLNGVDTVRDQLRQRINDWYDDANEMITDTYSNAEEAVDRLFQKYEGALKSMGNLASGVDGDKASTLAGWMGAQGMFKSGITVAGVVAGIAGKLMSHYGTQSDEDFRNSFIDEFAAQRDLARQELDDMRDAALALLDTTGQTPDSLGTRTIGYRLASGGATSFANITIDFTGVESWTNAKHELEELEHRLFMGNGNPGQPVLEEVPNAPPPIDTMLGELWIQLVSLWNQNLRGSYSIGVYGGLGGNFWSSDELDNILWWDATDIADELNSLGYERELNYTSNSGSNTFPIAP